jgi:hypothetical protein
VLRPAGHANLQNFKKAVPDDSGELGLEKIYEHHLA